MLNSPLGGRRGIGFGLGRSWQRKVTGGFSPTDIAGLQLWLDFSDASTLFIDAGVTPVSADNDLIYQANDKSGNANNATQTIEANRPLYKVNRRNSLSTSYWDGSNDSLLISGLKFSATVTGFFVGYFLDTNQGIVLSNRTASIPINYELYSNGSGAGLMDPQTNTRDDASNLRLCKEDNISTNWYTFQAIKDDASGTNKNSLYKNGSLVGQSAAVTLGAITAPDTYIGSLYDGSLLYEADMCEIVVYDAILSESDRGLVETYLNTKWAIY